MNKRKAIPKSENIFTASNSGKIPRKKGPAIIPEIMYPTINGCFNNRIINDTASTRRIIKLICVKTSVIFSLNSAENGRVPLS